jgi:hypothetical protein
MPTEAQLKYLEAFKKYGSFHKAAKELGVNYSTVRLAVKTCELAGEIVLPERKHAHIPPGYFTGKITTHVNYRNGPDGQMVDEWVRSEPAALSIEALIEYLTNRIPASPINIPSPTNFNPDIMLQIDLADAHFGMLAWRKETGDSDYDIPIARRLILQTMAEIFARSGSVKETLFVLYGDNFHADFFNPMTEKSRHHLDVDGRYPKVTFDGTDTFISAIEVAAAYSDKVKVIVLYGNHDKQTSVLLQTALHIHFRLADPGRITIDLEPSCARYHIWGCTAQVYHHGNDIKPERMAADIMRYVAEHDIAGVREYRANQAHLHKEERRDINGVIYECKPSIVARDAYAAGAMYRSRRACIATTFHKKYGELSRYTVTPRMLEAMVDS